MLGATVESVWDTGFHFKSLESHAFLQECSELLEGSLRAFWPESQLYEKGCG